MTQLEILIQTLCPNGVKMVKLGDVGTFENIGVDKKSNTNEQKVTLLNYVDIYKNKYIDASIPSMVVTAPDKKIEQCNVLQFDIFVTPTSETRDDIGHAAVVLEDLPNVVYSYHIMRFRLVEPNLNTAKFIRYLFETPIIQKQIYKAAKGLTRFGLSKYQFADLQIPLPPLAVQSEIVRLLDKFTLYKSELAAELAARCKQYEHYRNQLLTFDDTVKRVKLGEVGEFYGGLTGKTKEDFKEGNAKFITYKNIFSNLALDIDIEDRVFITEGEKQNIVQYGDVLFTGSSETPDECGMSSVLTTPTDEKLYLNSFCFGWRLFDKSIYLPDFLKHLFRCAELRKQIGKTASGVTRFNVSKAKMKKVSIPLPPLSEQERIVSILDRFDKLCHDIREGLPAEIELRQKQYEHYRDKLLTFTDIIGYKNL